MSEGQGAAPSAPTGAEPTTTATPKGAPTPAGKPGATPTPAPSGQQAAERIQEGLDSGELTEADLDRFVTVTVDGQKQRIKMRQALSDYSLRIASHKRLEEAAKTRKEIEAERAQMRQLVELMRDPAGLLSLAQELGVTTQALREHIEREAAIPADVKRERELARREKALQERDEAEKRAREQAKLDAETRQHRERYRAEIVGAAKGVGLPESPAVVGRMARLMAAALDAGSPITAEDAALTVREELSGEVGSLLRDADPDTLRGLLGDKLDAIRKQEVARATQGRDATRPRPGGSGGGQKAPQRERIPLGMLSPEELTERLNARRGR
ncbi:MAG: hypothetical protein MUF00_01655 [Gemmatimonadaceae bacterium]|jgi:hypothetical protein|nr:hypothetical protein [Gemmatimonadaceae bacterium]